MLAVRSLGCRSHAWCCGLPVLPRPGVGAGFQSPQAMLPHHPQRGRPKNSFSGSQAVCISCGSTLETQWLFWGLGGLRAFGGQVGKGKGCSSSLQQIALDLNKNFRCGIEILYFVFP